MGRSHERRSDGDRQTSAVDSGRAVQPVDGIEIKATWREEWVVHPGRRFTHGGILAAIIDVAADYAIAARLGRPVPTIDLRVDYHKAAMPGDVIAKARVLRLGGQYSTAEAYLYDSNGALVASGRGTYFTASPK